MYVAEEFALKHNRSKEGGFWMRVVAVLGRENVGILFYLFQKLKPCSNSNIFSFLDLKRTSYHTSHHITCTQGRRYARILIALITTRVFLYYTYIIHFSTTYMVRRNCNRMLFNNMTYKVEAWASLILTLAWSPYVSKENIF